MTPVLATTAIELSAIVLGIMIPTLAGIVRATFRIVRVVDQQLTSMDANTKAVNKLTERVDALERGSAIRGAVT